MKTKNLISVVFACIVIMLSGCTKDEPETVTLPCTTVWESSSGSYFKLVNPLPYSIKVAFMGDAFSVVPPASCRSFALPAGEHTCQMMICTSGNGNCYPFKAETEYSFQLEEGVIYYYEIK